MPNIYTAIAGIIDECKAIPKSKKNTMQNFNYRGIDDVMNTLQPLFAKYKVFVAPEILDCKREERTTNKGGLLIYTMLTVKYTFYADDGSSITATVQGEAMDSADKSSNKAMSAAFKYALFQVFCIPTEEMHDPDADSPALGGAPELHCSDCKRIIQGDSKLTARQIADRSKEKFGRVLCVECAKKAVAQ